MLGARLGHFYDKPLGPLAKRIRISPNAITVAGFVVTAIGAVVMAERLFLGGLVVLAGSVMDAMDGVVARAQGRSTKFGAFLDSVLDRYADALIFLGLAWNLGSRGDHVGAFLSLGTLVGAFVISYAKARAEGLGASCESGIMERPERIALVVLGALTGWIVPALWAMFFLTHITALQRIHYVWIKMKS